MGDTYELEFHTGNDGTRSLRYILWVPWYMHLLVKFFDYMLGDGSHGFSKYGWKFLPLCIIHSGGKTLPVASVFALEEDSQALNMLLVSVHCHKSSCECTLYNSSRNSCVSTWRTMVWIAMHSNWWTKKTQVSVHFENFVLCKLESDNSTGAIPHPKISDEIQSWVRKNLRCYLYPSEWNHFMYMHECQKSDAATLLAIMPQMSLKSTLHCDAGPAFIGLSQYILFYIISILVYI
jgi:hypothetical protein